MLGRTEEHGDGPGDGRYTDVRRFRLVVVEGGTIGSKIESVADRCSIGSDPSNDLVLDEPTVSRFHCEVRVGGDGATVVDLGSRNGTVLDGVRIKEAYLKTGSVLRLGRAAVRFDYDLGVNRLPLSDATRLGDVVGGSATMRATYAMLERAAGTDVTVLLDGETGTGKSIAAFEVHRHGRRADAPFVTVDCSAIPHNLLDSELFGHEKGAFTGADARRVGAFEEADGGTIFLDEISEMPLDLQTKLLRIIETRQLRRVGASKTMPLDVRVIAATNRDLRQEVNEGRFRSDLYFRLAVVRIRMPALREHAEDIPVIVEQMLRSFGASPEETAQLAAPAVVAALGQSAWPGNVRELRNHIQRCLFFGRPLPTDDAAYPDGTTPTDGTLEYAEARRRASAEFERRYLTSLLARHGGNVAAAADAARMHRVSLYRLIREHGLQPTTRGRTK